MEGHVEKGKITFRLYDKGEGSYRFTINSMSEVDQTAAKVFEGTARSEQKKSWNEVLDNLVKDSEGQEKDRVEKIVEPSNEKTEN